MNIPQDVKLSNRLRAGVECARWVIDEVRKLEAALRDQRQAVPDGWRDANEEKPFITGYRYVSCWFNSNPPVTLTMFAHDELPNGTTHWKYVNPPNAPTPPSSNAEGVESSYCSVIKADKKNCTFHNLHCAYPLCIITPPAADAKPEDKQS